MLRKRGKKGQITIFIIIAIVIVAVVLLVIFVGPRIADLFMSEQQAAQVLASQVEPLRDAVADCVGDVSKDFFIEIGNKGGYYGEILLPIFDFADHEYTVIMYKDNNKVRVNKLPLVASIEDQYKNFLENEGYEKIDDCLNDLASFKRQMDIEIGTRKITADIRDESIIFNVDWPMTVKKSTVTKTITQQVTQKDAELLIPFGNVWRVADDIVECEVQVDCDFEGQVIDKYIWDNPELLRYISFTLRSINENNIVWILETQPYRSREEIYRFYFGIKRE